MLRSKQTTPTSVTLCAGPTLFDVIKAPYQLGWAFLLAWVFCVFYLRIFGIISGDVLIAKDQIDNEFALFFDASPVLVSISTLLVVIGVERRFGPPSSHPLFEIAMTGVATLGTPALVILTNSAISTAFIFGIAALLTGIGSGVMWVSWGEYYAELPQENVEMIAPVSAVLGALITLAVSAMTGWVSVAIVASFPLLSGICLLVARKENVPEAPISTSDASFFAPQLTVVASMKRTLMGIMAACLFTCIAGALFEKFDSLDNVYVQTTLVASIIFTLAISFVSVVGPRRISISFFYRWMCPALILGFAAIILFGEATGAYLAFMISIASRFAFCLITQMYFARVASEDKITAVQAYGWGWISVHLGDFLGILAVFGINNLVLNGEVTLEQIAAASMVILVVVTMFVINDKHSFSVSVSNTSATSTAPKTSSLNISTEENGLLKTPSEACMFTDANLKLKPHLTIEQEENTASALDPTSSLDERINTIAHSHGLTPRESEVFSMLARGRSIPYVRDALVISRETAATHAKHIYHKLDIHSRQELIDLVTGDK